jgi:hypothetical protein
MWYQLASNTNISKPMLTKVVNERGRITHGPKYYRKLAAAPNFGTNRSQLVRPVELAVSCTTVCRQYESSRSAGANTPTVRWTPHGRTPDM